MGHLTPASLVGPNSDGSFPDGLPPNGPNGAYFNLAVEMFRETFPSSITPALDPVLHMAYWHLRLLAYLLQPSALSSDVMWATRSSVELLNENATMLSPLSHHFTTLTALSLLELTKVEKARLEATRLLRELLDSPIPASAWRAAVRDRIAAHIRPSTSSGAANGETSQSLQHLADLATATGLAAAAAAAAAAATNNNDDTVASAADGAAEKIGDEEPPAFRGADNYEAMGFNPRPMLREGYLNLVASSGPAVPAAAAPAATTS